MNFLIVSMAMHFLETSLKPSLPLQRQARVNEVLLASAEAKQPEDWDEEEDGVWEPPRIANPLCKDAPGCGEWTRPNKPNPAYKGKWVAPLIDNPDYKVRCSLRSTACSPCHSIVGETGHVQPGLLWPSNVKGCDYHLTEDGLSLQCCSVL